MESTLQTDPQTPLAEVEYELTMEDYLAFCLDFAERSVVGRYSRMIAYGFAVVAWLGIPLCIIGFLLAGELEEVPQQDAAGIFAMLVFFAVGFFVLFPIVMYFVLPRALRNDWITRWWIRRIVSDGKAGNLLGRYRLRLTNKTLTEWSPVAVSEVGVSAIDRLIVTSEHAFVFTSPVQAAIVPRRAFTSGNTFEHFVRSIEQFVPTRTIR
jgi:hypothetical protein